MNSPEKIQIASFNWKHRRIKCFLYYSENLQCKECSPVSKRTKRLLWVGSL